MNQNVRIGRLAIGALCASIGLGMSHPAHAGTWEFTQTSSGTNVSPSNDSPTWQQSPGLIYGSSPISTSGTFNYHCKWTPASIEETIPKGLRVPIFGSMTVVGNPYVDPTGELSIAGKAASGLTKEGFNTYKWILDFAVLVSVPGGGESGNGQVKEFDISFPVSASCSSSGYGGNAVVNVLEPVEDDRSVKISRGGRFEHSELSNGEWHTYGDSIYSAEGPQLIGGVNSSINFGVDYLGSWSTQAPPHGDLWDITPTWSIAGLNPIAEQDEIHAHGRATTGTPTVDVLGNYAGSATESQAYDTSYTAEDNTNGATATAHYHLTLHDPVEPLSEGEMTETYTVKAPMYLGSQIMAWHGPRDANSAEDNVKTVTSVEAGVGLTATTSVDAFKGLLGFSAEANLTSTLSISVDTDTKVPAISTGNYVYLIAKHSFQRTHTRFYKYDQAGRVPRMVTMNSFGTIFNPPVEVYHEAFRDNAYMRDKDWSLEIPDTLAFADLPQDSIPAPQYNFSGDTS